MRHLLITLIGSIGLCTAWEAARADDFANLVGRVSAAVETEAPRDDARLAQAVSEEAIDHRRRMVIRFASTDPYWVTKRKNPKNQNPLAACRLAVDPADEETLTFIRESLGYRGKDDSFSHNSLAALYCRYGQDWDEELREAVRREVTTYDGFLRGGTENHIAMRRTAGYLFGERFPTETFHYGLTGRELSAECLRYIRQYGHAIYESSQVEYLSPAYLGVNMTAWLHVAEFAEDASARLCAQAVLDWLFADLAINMSQGVIVPPLQREKGLLLERYQLSHARSLAQFVAWLYFGSGNTPWDGQRFADEKYAPGFPHSLCVDQFAVSRWRPSPVIRNVAAKRLGMPYMLWQSRGNWPCIEPASINPYGKTRPASSHTYPADPRYHLRSVYSARDYALGAGVFRENMADPLLRTAVPFGVVWRTGDDQNMLLVAHPFWYTQRTWEESDDALGDEDWLGISPFGQAVHWENAAILLYDLPATDPYQGAAAAGSPKFLSERGPDVHQAVYVYVPEEADEVIEASGRFFFREGEVYVAVLPLADGAGLEDSRHPGYRRVRLPGSVTGCVVELGDRRRDGSFDDFRRRVAETELDLSRLASDKEVVYCSTRGHRLRLRHRPTGWVPEAEVNGTRLDYDRWPIGESPYVRCRDRVLDVNDGVDGFSIDWTGDDPKYTYYRIVDGRREILDR